MGSSPSTPDIRVRLSADGVQDVINALRLIKQEAQQAGQGAASGLGLMNTALREFTTLLPAISLAVVVQQTIALGVGAFNTAVEMEKLSLRTGVTTGTLSVFGLAAKESGTDMEGASRALVRLQKSAADAGNGVAKPKKAFSDLGITLTDLKTLTPDQLLVRVANGLAQIESPATRAQAAMALLGREGAQLLPLFNQIAEQGFGNLEDKAKRLGVYIGDDFEEKARKTKIAVADLQAAVEGMAMQFVNGAIPAVEGVAGALSDLAGGGDGFYKFGQTIGAAVLYVTSGFVSLSKEITIAGANFDMFANKARAVADLTDSKIGFTSGQRAAAAAGYGEDQQNIGNDKNTINQAKADAAAAQQAIAAAYTKLYADPKSYKAPSLGSGVDGEGKTVDDKGKDAAARSAYLQALADNEVAILKTKNEIEGAEDKRAYDAGILSVDQYYDKVDARAQQSSDAELGALAQKYQAASQLPQLTDEQSYKRATAMAKINAQEVELELKTDAARKASDDERSAARIANATKELEITKRLQEASGQRSAAAQTGLQIEINDYERLLRTQGLSTQAIKDQIVAYKQRGEAKIGFDQNQKSASSVSGAYGDALNLIDAQQGSGAITDYQAQAQRLAFQQEELTKLQAIGTQMQENATASADPDAIEFATRFNNSLVIQQQRLRDVTSAATELKNQLSTEGRAAVGDFFTTLVDGSKSAADAFKDLGSAFEKIVANMISQLLIFYALEAIVGFIAPNSDFASSLKASGPFGKFAGGGYTGNIPVDKVAGVVHGQEFVSDASATARYLPILQAMQAGTFDAPGTSTPFTAARTAGTNLGLMAPVSTAAATAAVADAAASASSPSVSVTVENHTGQQATQSRQTGSGGQEFINIVIGAVTSDIASGGKIGKQMQTTFGVTRQGVGRTS